MYEHYKLYINSLIQEKREPAPAWPWTVCNRCSESEDPNWREVFKRMPVELMGDSFLAPSGLRNSGLAIWDAAVAAGTPMMRTEGIRRPEEMKTHLKINDYYQKEMGT